jgi:hypothetical protein
MPRSHTLCVYTFHDRVGEREAARNEPLQRREERKKLRCLLCVVLCAVRSVVVVEHDDTKKQQ